MLKKCPDCEGTVSNRAHTCVHCGFPIRQDQPHPRNGRMYAACGLIILSIGELLALYITYQVIVAGEPLASIGIYLLITMATVALAIPSLIWAFTLSWFFDQSAPSSQAGRFE